jgi:hypothetical protein
MATLFPLLHFGRTRFSKTGAWWQAAWVGVVPQFSNFPPRTATATAFVLVLKMLFSSRPLSLFFEGVRGPTPGNTGFRL